MNNFEDNKIIYTTNIFEVIKYFSSKKDTLTITPLTKIEEIFNFKSNNVLMNLIKEENYDEIQKFINEKEINNFVNSINTILNINILDYEIPFDKIMKFFIFINEKQDITEEIILKFLDLLDKYTKKNTKIIITGFDNNLYLKIKHYSNINILIITNSLMGGLIKWETLENLIIYKNKEFIDVLDKEKFISYLETKSKTVLTKKDINNYFSGEICMNSFIIDKSIKSID